jgi:hypothetical protein
MKLSHWVAEFVFLFLTLGSSASAQVLNLPDDPSTRACSTEQVDRWKNAMADSLGVIATDPWHEQIGSVAAVKSSAIVPTWAEYLMSVLFLGGLPGSTIGRQWNWVPAMSTRQMMCGKLFKYEFFPNQAADKEEDSTLYTEPTAARFLDVFSVGKQRANDVHDCDATDDCLEAEITLPPAARGTAELPQNNDSVLEGQQICAYGPFANETVHGSIPEIHPAQGLWWKDAAHSGVRPSLVLLSAQDASTRFDSRDDFTALSVAAPDGWHPWAEAPVTTTFRVAVSAPFDEPEPSMIWLLHQDHGDVVTEKFQDLSERGPLDLMFRGRLILRVTDIEQGLTGVGLEDVCSTNSQWIGFLRIVSAVGKTGQDPGGYDRMMIYWTGSKPDPLKLLKSTLLVRIDPKTIRVDNQGVISSSVVLVARVPSNAPSFTHVVPRGGDPKTINWTPEGDSWTANLGTVQPGELSLKRSDGNDLHLGVPTARPTISVLATPKRLQKIQHSRGNWPVPINDLPSGLELVVPAEWDLVAIPHFVSQSEGRDSPEDEGTIAERLDEMSGECLRGDSASEKACAALGGFRTRDISWFIEEPGTHSRPDGMRLRPFTKGRLVPGLGAIVEFASPDRAANGLVVKAQARSASGSEVEGSKILASELLVGRTQQQLAKGVSEWLKATGHGSALNEGILFEAAADGRIEPDELRAALASKSR